ncbi:NAD(P)/FAD-dependent oxidoreductase [Marinisporobacter balticus]|uniref:Flavin-dependent dehydrogenase n=1 Tax=Marinisporobacter balticus TaxID=2018667 RepID=A0A4R2KNC2_9FIRM|nr:NAD(P)-binding protein [Marinisporobacter balticus]TCO74964.1 flavin-dependent dehydrogenase [Marinisporobacter balticus]
MKVAIIGSGLSGLSCAFELKKYGITPTIFEKKNTIGDPLDYTVLSLRMFHPYLETPMDYFEKNYNLKITSFNPLRKIMMLSPNKNTIVRGNLGYIFKKNREINSLENQIMQQVNLPIAFDQYINIRDIQNDFDHIVCANGNHEIANTFNNWTSTLNVHTRIATVVGNFKPNVVKIWVNTTYAKHTYAYLLPYSAYKANLTLIVDNTSYDELDYYWKKFLNTEHLLYKILETRDIEQTVGSVNTLKLGNLYFVGNAGGFLDSLLGFGSMNAIESGLMAGKCIANNLDYNKLLSPILKDLQSLHNFRKRLNTFENRDFDRLITFLGLPIIKQYIYNNPFCNISKLSSFQNFFM